MKVAQIKSAPQFVSRDWRQYGIQTYGDTNDFPQTVSEIVQASKTGNACVSIYNDFVYGHGFKDPGIYRLRVNKEGEKLDKILRMVCKDFTVWHGFAILRDGGFWLAGARRSGQRPCDQQSGIAAHAKLPSVGSSDIKRERQALN